MRKYVFTVLVLCNLTVFGQSPQNINVGSGESESLWSSNTGVTIFVVFVVLLFAGRTWSKRIHKKRDELSDKK